MHRIKAMLFSLSLVATLLAAALPVYTASPSRLVLVSKLDGPPLPADLKILEEYDAFVLAEVPPEALPALQARYLVDPLPNRTVIALNGRVWDTAHGEPAIPESARSRADDPYFLLQFYGPVKNEWVADLEAVGVEFLGYHPNYTYIVRMDPTLTLRVERAHAVAWVQAYHPAYRLPEAGQLDGALTFQGLTGFTIRLFPGADRTLLQRRLEALGVSAIWAGGSSAGEPVAARVWATPEQLPELAAVPGVYRIEPRIAPSLDNERAAQVMHTWDVRRAARNGLEQDLMGSGQVAGMVDSGLDNNTTAPNINDFYSFDGGTQTTRVEAAIAGSGCGQIEKIQGVSLRCECYSFDDALNSGHGTHVAGSIVSNGYNALMQRGLEAQAHTADPMFDYAFGVGQAPEAQLSYSYVGGEYCYQFAQQEWVCGDPNYQGSLCGIDWGTGTSYATWANVYSGGARNVNNSWGSSATTYDGDAVLADQIMWDRQDYLVVTSAGNAGPGWQTVGQPGNAKNLVTVGAAGNHRSTWGQTSDTAHLLTDFSSRGPTAGDLRFKPDVVAPGADVLSTRSTFIPNDTVTLWMNEPGDGNDDGHQDYWWSGGTSMSSPLVTGAVTLIRQYLQDIKGLGDTTPPSAALIKAMLANGAVDMGYGYEAFTTAPYGGRNLQGWGMVNVEQSITPRAPRSFLYEDFTDITGSTTQSTIGPSASGEYVEYTLDVVDATEPLKITLTWTDPQNGNQGSMVNDLDLLVTSPGGGSQYRGNVFAGSWSTSGGSADRINNTEAVYLLRPAIGSWTVRVTDFGHGSGTQPYALVVSGGLGTDPALSSRTCSWGACPATRSGNSSQPYFPSLKPLAGTEEHTPAGGSFATSFRLTNWGTNTDTINLSSTVSNMAGSSATGITVAFNPTTASLPAGDSVDVQATVFVDGGVASGPYDVSLVATSSGAVGRQDVQVIGVNVLPDGDLPNETRVILDGGPQFAHAFWGTDQTLWTAYLSAQSHNNSEAKIYAAHSTDGGQTWTNMGQVDANDGKYYYGPAIAGNADGTSVTVVWVAADGSGVYARTWTGSWGSTHTLHGSTYFLSDPAVIYDNDGHILAVWLRYDQAGTNGLYYSLSTDDGINWSTSTYVPGATGGTQRWASLALDTRNNHVWAAYANPVSGANRDVRATYWNGSAWAANTIGVATTPDRESRPAIAYVQGADAASDALWIAWVRYPGWTDVTPRVYYARSSGTLPAVTFPTINGPHGTRVAELAPAVAGDASYTYLSYLAYDDDLRGGNVYMLRVPAAGGDPEMTHRLSATVDDPPLYARGNAGIPRLLWLTTTVNGLPYTGPTLLYSKNPPDSENPDYSTSLGVAQTLYNCEENVDLYLSQAGNPAPTAVTIASFYARPAGAGIHIEWATATEIDLLGFNLYRGDAVAGPYARLNDALIPGKTPGSASGALYTWLDEAVRPGDTYYYKLEGVDVHGASLWYGPVEALLPRSIYLPLVVR